MVTEDKKEIIEEVVDDTKQEDEKPDKKKKTLSVSDGEKKNDQTILTPL